MKQFSYKVPGGKLIKVKIFVEDNRIRDITITGDFFLHPEECILAIEENLSDCQLEPDRILKQIDNALMSMDARLIGATPSDFVFAIMKAVES